MSKSKFTMLDSLSLQDFDENSELIPLMTSEDEEAIKNESLPESLPILSLRNTVLFPGVVIPINAGRDKSIKLINDANKAAEKVATRKASQNVITALAPILPIPIPAPIAANPAPKAAPILPMPAPAAACNNTVKIADNIASNFNN